MAEVSFTCPRCFLTAPLRSDMLYCPRCGLPNARESASDTSSLDIQVGGRAYRVHERMAIGSLCNVYRCSFQAGGRTVEGVFKIARDASANALLTQEAAILRRLRALDESGRLGPFLPRVVDSFGFRDQPSTDPRQANVLQLHDEIRSPYELYTLEEVRSRHAPGVDPADMAWIWRRLLSVLGLVHAHDIVHGAVLPMHILIEPREHKLALVDWCCAVSEAQANRRPPAFISGGHRSWYEQEGGVRRPPTPGLDVALGGRCMIELLGGDPVRAEFPPALDPALKRYFERCVSDRSGQPPYALKLLDDFDRLIEALWGPRKFRVMTMPPKKGT